MIFESDSRIRWLWGTDGSILCFPYRLSYFILKLFQHDKRP